MEEFLNNIYDLIINIINSSNIFGPLFACFLIFIESILPVLPLFVFITIIFVSYGYFIGFIISYILTICGCCFSFYLCRNFLNNFFNKKIRKIEQFDKIMQRIDSMKLSNLVLIVAIPFTPAFLINIAASLSKMKFKKFLTSILIGKISIVFFWGFIGTSLLESLKNPKILFVILIMLGFSYLLGKFVTKKLNIE